MEMCSSFFISQQIQVNKEAKKIDLKTKESMFEPGYVGLSFVYLGI